MSLNQCNWYRAKKGGIWYFNILPDGTTRWERIKGKGTILCRNYDTYKDEIWEERKAKRPHIRKTDRKPGRRYRVYKNPSPPGSGAVALRGSQS